jgi:phospholipase D1/2
VAVQRPKYPIGKYLRHPLSPLHTKDRGHQGTVHAQVVRSSGDWSSGILVEHSIQNAYCETIRKAEHFVYIENQFFITATGEEQAPIHNLIGAAIVDACVRAGKEGRKFRVIMVIPAIPGFAGDLRDDAAMGTRAIMDYQYKSINRGEHSIMERIKAQGVDPTQHIFVFNLRSYDRLNKTKVIQRQEEISGVKYEQVQRAHAEEVMGTGMNMQDEDSSTGKKGRNDTDEESTERHMDQKRQFEEKKDEAGGNQEPDSADNIGKDAMLNEPKPSEENWEGNSDEEKENFVQEELYIHAKVG